MKVKGYNYSELGMLLGTYSGGGLATILFAATGIATYFAFGGIGLALGLGLGAAFEGSMRSAQNGDRPSNQEGA
jgi:hypothetical protein